MSGPGVLLDHFHPPLGGWRDWHAFFSSWATSLSADLNARLPADDFAENDVRFTDPNEPVVEVGAFRWSGRREQMAVIALVCPAHKEQSASREAFVSKCAGYLQAGIGLIVVDVVTDRHADLHAELLARLGLSPTPGTPLYATAYRPVVRGQSPELDVWREDVTVGRPLPTLPLWLRGGLCLPVELQASYDRTCREQRVTPAA